MVKIEENKLIITLPHPCPADALQDLQKGIIAALKYQCEYYNTELGFEEELLEGNVLLLQLLEATLNKEEEQTTNLEQ